MRKLFALLILSACTTAGVKVEKSHIESFQKGKTTYEEMVQSLGNPTQILTTSNGEVTAIYSYVSAQARPESFIPLVGIFVGGTDVENTSVMMTFDNSGRFKDFTTLQGSVGSGHGLQGISTSRNTNQPRKQ